MININILTIKQTVHKYIFPQYVAPEASSKIYSQFHFYFMLLTYNKMNKKC